MRLGMPSPPGPRPRLMEASGFSGMLRAETARLPKPPDTGPRRLAAMPWIIPALLVAAALVSGAASRAEEARPPEGVERPFAEPGLGGFT